MSTESEKRTGYLVVAAIIAMVAIVMIVAIASRARGGKKGVGSGKKGFTSEPFPKKP